MPTYSTDFDGRVFSLAVTDMDVPESRVVRLGFSNKSVTGVQKLIDRYIVLFLDVLGTNKYHPEQGTKLLSSILSGNVVASGQIQHILNFANTDAAAVIANSEFVEDPDDERLASSAATLVGSSAGQVSIRVDLETRSGKTVQFILPANLAIP